jgi:predicted Zn-dependent protease
MSLIADLLSKVSSKQTEGSVPPGLTRSVVELQSKASRRRKYVLVSVAAVLLIASGIGLVYYVRTISGNSMLTPEAKSRIENLKGSSNRLATVNDPSQNHVLPPAPTLAPPLSQQVLTPQEAQVVPKIKAKEKDIAAASAPKDEGHALPPRLPKTVAVSADKSEKTDSINPGREMALKQKAAKDELLYEAQNLEAAKDYDGALHLYKKALDIDRQNYVVLNNMAGIMIVKGSFKEAEEYSRASLKVNGTYAPSLINLGIALIRLGNGEEGKEVLTKALSIEPSNPHGLVNLALLLEKQNNIDEAKRYFSALTDLKDGRGYLGLARLAENTGKIDEAKRTYRLIVASDAIDNSTKRFATERLSILEGR